MFKWLCPAKKCASNCNFDTNKTSKYNFIFKDTINYFMKNTFFSNLKHADLLNVIFHFRSLTVGN